MTKPITDSEVVSMFQRYLGSGDPSEIDGLDLQNLITSEARLALRGTNPDFTAVIRAQIRKLEQIEQRKHESKIRAGNLVTGLILGLAIAGISHWLFGS